MEQSAGFGDKTYVKENKMSKINRITCAVFFISMAVLSVSVSAGIDDGCYNIFKQEQCNLQSNCTWCISAAIPSNCYSLGNAKKLPPSIFKCAIHPVTGFEQVIKPAEIVAEVASIDDGCYNLFKQPECNLQANCTWCISAAIPSNCYSLGNAKRLPPSIFKCAIHPISAFEPVYEPTVVLPAEPIESDIHEAAIDDGCYNLFKQPECNLQANCTWCISAAIPSNCYSLGNAKRLPPSIFKCAIHPFVMPLINDACQDLDQNDCSTTSDCTWCKSAAVGSKCYTVENSKRLPPSIFACGV